MYSTTFLIFSLFIIISSTYTYFALGQNYNDLVSQEPKIIKWCVVGIPEYKKCMNFSEAVYRDKWEYQSNYYNISCIKAFSKDECMKVIEGDKADLTSLDAGEVFSAGRYYSLVPILQEFYKETGTSYYAVALIKKDSLKDVTNLRQLRGKKACFPGVESLAGWIIPIVKLMERAGLEIVDCNNHVKNAVNFFGPSCAVNSLLDKYNPIGDNSDKLCKLCIGKIPGGKCTTADPYAGFTGAFRCLLEAGEIAFLKHTTAIELTSDQFNFPTISKNDFELLCLDGSRKPIDEFTHCQWGSVPSHAIVISSAKDVKTRVAYQKFLEIALQRYTPELAGLNGFNFTTPKPFDNYGRGSSSTEDYYNRNRDGYGREQGGLGRDDYWNRQNEGQEGSEYDRNFGQARGEGYNSEGTAPQQPFHLFESVPRYGLEHDLMFSDTTLKLVSLKEGTQTFKEYLGRQLDLIERLRNCPVKAVTLCITSEPELEKCLKMRTALKAQLLEPELVCFKGYSHTNCMQAIRDGDADISVFDAGDIYSAGLNFRLVPIMAEIYNLGVPEYYAVAVAKEEDPDTEITYLKGKNTCHGGVNTGAGWVVPMAFLLSNGWMRGYGCDAMKAAAEYFSKMCLPGSQSTEYNTGVPYDNMCQLCHGSSYKYCHRDAAEDYYGHTGAFRCLVEGGGDVAFVKHTTVIENTDGKRKEWWARNTLNEDFQLLCPDGTRQSMDHYQECNLGRVKANAIVTRGGDAYNITQINAIINLFTYAQQFYGRKDQDDFNFAMFSSRPPYADLIFQDATTQLMVIPPRLRWYSDYLGKDFLRAKRLTDCYAGASFISPSLMIFAVLPLTCLLYF